MTTNLQTKQQKTVDALESFVNAIETNTSIDEIMEAFAAVVAVAQEIKAFTEEEITRLNTLTEQTTKVLKELNDKKLSEMHSDTDAKLQKKLLELTEKVEKKLATVKDGIDGKDGESVLLDDVLPEVLNAIGDLPTKEEVSEEVTKNGEAVRDALELLDGEERLDASAIKGLEELIKKHAGGKTMVVPNGGASGGKIVKVHDLSDDLDGSTKIFSLPAFYRILTVDLSSFPNALRPTIDYTSDGAAMTITFTSEIDASTSLAAGQTCIITYAEI